MSKGWTIDAQLMDSLEYVTRAVNSENTEDATRFSEELSRFSARNGQPEKPKMTLEEHEKLFGH